MGNRSIFDEEIRLAKLSALGDSLVKLNSVIEWEMFRPMLTRVFKKTSKGAGGRPPFDCVLMFKVLILQRIYNLSDDQTEFQINDRMSFMRFLGLGLEDKVPDAKTIWLFRDTLVKAGVMHEMFDLFAEQLQAAHLITHTGTIVDATFVDAPKPRINREEREELKKGNIPEEWKKPENKNKLRQKETDGRFTRKGREFHFGFKNTVKVDADSKVILDYETTHAAVHDSQMLPHLISENDQVLYADSAYWGKPVAEALPSHVENRICERGTKVKPLTEEQRLNNRLKSKIRCRIEHVFGFMTNSMHGLTLRSIGMARAEFNIGLTNLIYNLFRYEFLTRSKRVIG